MGLHSSMDAFGLLQTFPSDGSTTARCQLLPFGLYVTKDIPKGNTWIDVGTVSLGNTIPTCVFANTADTSLISQLSASSELIVNDPDNPVRIGNVFGDLDIGASWSGGTVVNISVSNKGQYDYNPSFKVAGWIIMGF